MSAADYSEMSREAALRFLQTAVVVDDAATVETEEERSQTARSPGLSDRIGATDEDNGVDGTSKSESDPPPVRVDVKGLADVLADLGITCGVLRPKADEGVKTVHRRIAAVSARVDLVVLDWMLDEDTELTSLNAIKQTVQADRRGCRVIAVYTSQSNLGRISEELKGAIPDIEPVDQSESMLRVGGTRIALIRKAERESSLGHVNGGGAGGEDDQFESLTVEELGPRLVEIFTQVAEGWVRAVALQAMAAIRENFHMVLSGLDTSLDLGYAGNLLRLEHIEEGPRHLLDSIGGEFRGVIEDDLKSTRIAGRPALDAWLAERADRDALPAPPELLARLLNEPKENRDNVRALIKDKINESNRYPELSMNRLKKEGVTIVLSPGLDHEVARKADGEFAKLLALRRFHGDTPRTLHLGTIVRERGGGYWLCVQPVCDSVRLDEDTSRFPMVPLESVDGKPFHFVVTGFDGDQNVQLRNSNEPHTIEMFEFDPDAEAGTVLFKWDRRVSKQAPFVRTRDETVLEWIGELKPTHSNRVAHGLGRQLTRIGLDESEWLQENSS